MAYKVIILYQLYMPSYFLGTFTEYPCLSGSKIVSTFFQRFKAASQNFFRIDYVDKGFGVDFCNPMP